MRLFSFLLSPWQSYSRARSQNFHLPSFSFVDARPFPGAHLVFLETSFLLWISLCFAYQRREVLHAPFGALIVRGPLLTSCLPSKLGPSFSRISSLFPNLASGCHIARSIESSPFPFLLSHFSFIQPFFVISPLLAVYFL